MSPKRSINRFLRRIIRYTGRMEPTLKSKTPELAPRLLEWARRVAGPLQAGDHFYSKQLFSYCRIERENLKAVELPNPVMSIVIYGKKEIWLGDNVQVYQPGTVLVLPRGVPIDVVNIPDDSIGFYGSLCLEISSVPLRIAPLSPNERAKCLAEPGCFAVPLNAPLVDALIHATAVLADGGVNDAVKHLRLEEVLTLLRPQPEARMLFRLGPAEEVAWLIGAAPSEPWSVDAVSKQLGVSGSTLRRQLSAAGTSFRAILRQERLRAGRRAIASGASSLAAAEAAGYTSRSHFSKRFRESFGTSPTGRN